METQAESGRVKELGDTVGETLTLGLGRLDDAGVAEPG